VKNPEPKVTLLSWTNLPLETVYSVWQASKNEMPLLTPEWVKDNVDPEAVRTLFRAVIAQRIPIGEHVDFVFMVENVSVSWREQAVRHRIGVSPSPERVGVDLGALAVERVPDLSESSWWSQSMRIQNMGQFATNGAYRLPKTVGADNALSDLFHQTMLQIEAAYNALVEAGVPMEDARELIPLGAQHRISWRLNIGALQHIVGKRGCWILQLGIWGPVIKGMIKELVTKVDPIFGELVTPPCLDGDRFRGCVYHEECHRRLDGIDALPPCPLHFHYHALPESLAKAETIALSNQREIQEQYGLHMAEEMRARALDYMEFWGRDPYTGARLG